MGKVVSLVANALMHSCNNLATLLAHRIGLFVLLDLIPSALRSCKCLFFLSEKSRVRDFLTRAECGKLFKSYIYADIRSLLFLRNRHIAQITRDGGEPFACCCAGYRASFGYAFNRTVLHNSKTSDLSQSETFFIQTATIRKLWVGNGIIAALSLVSGETRFFAFLLDAAKERLECKVNPCYHLLQHLAMHLLKHRVLLLHHRQCFHLVVAGQRLFFSFPGLHPCTDQLVIQQSAFFSVRQQDFLLLFRWTQSVFKRLKHNKNIYLRGHFVK